MVKFESYDEIKDGYAWFDGQHDELSIMTREEVIEYINFLQGLLNNSKNE